MALRPSKSIILLGLLVAFALALASNSRAPGISGRVEELVREDSGALRTVPRPRADILIIWRGNLLNNPVDSPRVCLRAVRVVSDDDGSFSRPGWWAAPTWPLITNITVSVYVYVPGYMTVGPLSLTNEEAQLLKPYVHMIKRDSMAQSRAEWLQASVGCGVLL